MNSIARLENQTGKEIKAFIFDLDGLLVESEEYWDEARAKVVKKYGGSWTERDQKKMMGLNSREWAEYIETRFKIRESKEEIIHKVKRLVLLLYKNRGIPLIGEAVKLLKTLSRKLIPPHKKCFPIAIATSSPKEIADFILKKSGLDEYVPLTVSSDQVKRGKPYPDVYLKTAKLLGEKPKNILVFEDSPNGVLAAKAAGMAVIAVPNKRYKFDESKFKKADFILHNISDFKI